MAQILIVDDTQETVEVLSMAVSHLGHQPVGVNSAEAAMRALEQRRPDLILIDFMMPGTDGLAALEAIRAAPHGKRIPILFSTASSDLVLEEKILAAGGDGLLRKPLGLRELEQAIALHIGPVGVEPLPA